MEAEPTEAPSRVPWTLRDMLTASVAAVVLFGLALGVVIAVVAVITAGSGAEPDQSALALVVFSLEGLLVVPAWVWGPRRYGGGWRALGLRGRPTWGMVGAAVLSLILVLAVNAGWEVVRQRLGWAGQPDALALFGGGIRGLLLALVLGGVVAPVAEEILFRGFLYAGLRARLGLGKGLVISAALFAIVHVIPGVLPPIWVMGLVFAWLYERYDSLWPCVMLHSLVNSLAFLASFLAERYPQWLGL